MLPPTLQTPPGLEDPLGSSLFPALLSPALPRDYVGSLKPSSAICVLSHRRILAIGLTERLSRWSLANGILLMEFKWNSVNTTLVTAKRLTKSDNRLIRFLQQNRHNLS